MTLEILIRIMEMAVEACKATNLLVDKTAQVFLLENKAETKHLANFYREKVGAYDEAQDKLEIIIRELEETKNISFASYETCRTIKYWLIDYLDIPGIAPITHILFSCVHFYTDYYEQVNHLENHP